MPAPTETFISVDVETSGPHPARYSLLSVGACLVDNPGESIYFELQPDKARVMESALRVSQLSLDRLARDGMQPAVAMQQFAAWLHKVTPAGQRPVMVAFNAPFDWSFINHYFLEYTAENPFGHAAIDIKAFYMGMVGCAWEETSMLYLSPRFLKGQQLPHDALADAQLQADLFGKLLAQSRGQSRPKDVEHERNPYP